MMRIPAFVTVATLLLAVHSLLKAQSGSFPADYDNDGTISLADFAAMQVCLTGPAIGPLTPECAPGDFDVDENIDMRDVQRFQSQFGQYECKEEPFGIDTLTLFNPDSIVITDLNNDLIQDLVATGQGTADLSISFGVGHGVFSQFETYASGAVTYVLVTADDFDNDGNIDLAVAGIPNPTHVTVFYGDGTGGLTMTPELLTWCTFSSRALWISKGDFDGNGLSDILLSTHQGLTCLLNNGDRTFRDPICLNSSTPFYFQAGDFNHDGLSDVAKHVGGGITILLSNGDGSFADAGNYSLGSGLHIPATGDLDGDGNTDLVVANRTVASSISVLQGLGDGTFNHLSDYLLENKVGIAIVSDINQDNAADVVTSTSGGNVVFLGEGDGTLVDDHTFGQGLAGTNNAPYIAIGELDGDGYQDLAVASFSSDVVAIILGQGDGRFEAPLIYPSSASEDRIVADFDNDGDLDVAVLGNGHLLVHSNVDSGTLIEAADYVTETRDGGRLAIADINRDGDLDLLAVSYGWHYLNVLLGKDGVAFDEPSIYYLGSYVSSIAATDYNNDSFVDVVLTNNEGILLVPGQMDGTFPSSVLIETEGTADDIIAGDFNHDGYSDLAILNSYFDAIDILPGAGDGTFGQVASEQTIANPLSLAFGDIDNDGLSDLIAVSKDALGLHVMNEIGAPEPMTTIVASSSGERVAVADVNHDSRTDIIYVETSFTSSASIVYGAGGGMFESPTTTNFFDGEFTRYAVQTADMTNDGLIDLVVFNESSITVAPNFCGS